VLFPHSKDASSDPIGVRDWNEEFQNILSSLSQSEVNSDHDPSFQPLNENANKLEIYRKLSCLAQDFVYVAKT
jgi:uncharacterized membrane protein YheB (UPF0754 family)